MNTNNENAPNTDAISAHPYKDAISAVKRGLLQGMGIALGFFGTTVFAVAVTGTIKTWTSGEVLKSADLNTTIASLKTAIEGITSSQWTTGGSNISYTNGNVGIGTSSPTTKVDVVASYAASFRGSSSSTDIDGGFFGIGVSSFSDQTGVIRFFDSAAQGSTNEFFVIKNSAAGSSPTAGLLNIKNSSGSIFKAQFNGNITIPGALSKGSGTFDIAHPDPSMPKNSRLRHSFVESPTAGDNIYRWQIKVTRENGKFFIRLPKYWTHLNTNPMVWVSSADQPAVSFGYVDMKQEKVIVQADRTGTYNVLLLGTRKDSLAADNWKALGMEYISKGTGEAEKVLSYNAPTEFGEEANDSGSHRLSSGEKEKSANEKKVSALEAEVHRLKTENRRLLSLEDRIKAIETTQMSYAKK